MARTLVALVLVALSLVLTAPGTPIAAQAVGADEYRSMYDALVSVRPDAQRVADVSSPVVLRRPGFQLVLNSGQISLLSIDGDVVGAAFAGSGAATVSPALAVEQKELERHLGSTNFRAEVERAAIFFTDETLAEMEPFLTFGPGSVEGGAEDVVERASRFLRGEEDGEYDAMMMSTFLNELDNAFFHAHLDVSSGPDLYYRYDDQAFEEATFGRDGPGDTYEVLTRFHPEDHYVEGAWLDEVPDHLVDLPAYDLDVHIDDDALTMHVEGSVEVTPRQDGPRWVPMSLFSDVEISELGWEELGDAVYFRPGDSSQLWVRLPDDAVEGRPLRLRVAYAGDIGQRDQGWYGLRSSTGWYPRYTRGWSTFDLTFHAPDNLHVVAAGDQVSREVQGDTVVTRWVTAEPAIHASFNVGPFEVEEFDEVPGVPPLTIQVQNEGHQRLIERGAIQQGNVSYKVGLDVANAIAFYSRVYGPVERDRFNVAEIPYAHGQAFPGMIHLSFITYFQTLQSGADESFRAHEVAHQWWGLGVQEKTPRDAWLEEGLSEFSSLWYMLKVKLDPARVYQLLQDKKEALVDLKDEAGPIWLGRYHLQNAEDGGLHYSTVVYDKGAWVFHMLRMLLIDLNSLDDTVFEEIMRNLYTRYRGGELSTAEFKTHLEAETGLDLEWFFQQWVYGTDIPRYTFSHIGRERDDGQYELVGKVVAEEVPDDFVAYVPILLDFGEGAFARVRAKVEGPESTIEFPPLPAAPVDVVFNDLQGVLAEVRTTGWSGPEPWGG